MPRTTPRLLPRLSRLVSGVGENIKKARLRRAYSSETVAQRAGIVLKTLYRMECGDPSVALSVYARVLQSLKLENDLSSIAAGDVLGRKLQDAGLEPKRRAPKQSNRANPSRDRKSGVPL